MAKPFKFRYVNELAGIFVLVIFCLFVAGIILAGRAQGWFEHYRHVSITFPASGSSGLKKGAEVEMLGTTAGTVDRISMDDEGIMHATVSIRSDFFHYVRRDSRVVIKKKFVVVGDAYVEITRGNEEEELPEGYVFSCEIGGELLDSIQALFEEAKEKKLIEGIREDSLSVRDALLDVLDRVGKFLDEYTALAALLNDPNADLRRLLSRIDRVAARLEAGRGTAGKLLADDALFERTVALVGEAERTMAEARSLMGSLEKTAGEIPDLSKAEKALDVLLSVLEDLKKTTAILPGMAERVRGELEDAPGTMVQIRADLKDAEDLLQALKRHWLIRGYVREEGPPAPIPPAAVYPPENLGSGGGREDRARGGGGGKGAGKDEGGGP